jgi:hypothetical protein
MRSRPASRSSTSRRSAPLSSAGRRRVATENGSRIQRPELGSYPRNPWTDLHAGREFLYDLRHPGLFLRRVLAGLRGEIPQVGKRQRLLSVGLMIVGGLNAMTGLAMVVRGAGWL